MVHLSHNIFIVEMKFYRQTVSNNLILMLKRQMTFDLLDIKHTNDILAVGCSGLSKWKMPTVKR